MNPSVEQSAGADEAPIGFWKQLAEDWHTNGKDWTMPGFRAVAVHRFGVWRMKIRPRLLRLPFSWLYRCLYRHVRNHYGIELPFTTIVGRRVQIGHQSGIVIHPAAEIGDDCLIRQNVTIGSAGTFHEDQAPKLGRNVQVGAGAAILGNITIGDNVKIGPNAVITMNVPAGSTVFADPARIMAPPKPKNDKEDPHRDGSP